MSDVVLAARRMLVGQSTLLALLGSDSTYGPWIFRWSPPFAIEATGSAALVLRQRGTWAASNPVHTLEFPRLEVETLVDPTRSSHPTGPTLMDAEERSLAVFHEFDRVLHMVDGSSWWDTQRVVSSKRLDGPAPSRVPGSDGLIYHRVSYAVTLG